MQRKMMFTSVVAASLIAGTAGAYAQTTDHWTGQAGEWKSSTNPAAPTAAPPSTYYHNPVGRNGSYRPAPGSTQGDVGPGGNNNGTYSGPYQQY